MIGVRVTVPIACWRKGHARELLETEGLPPPATCYGALLSFVGETDRYRHRGARLTAGLFNDPEVAQVLRSVWRVKSLGPRAGHPGEVHAGQGDNVRPDFQQLIVQADLLLLCGTGDEKGDETLEERVRRAFSRPEEVCRFGGWSLGESTHLINDAWPLEGPALPAPCRMFLADEAGTLTLPVWVDHVGSAGTRYVTGQLVTMQDLPDGEQLPRIDDG